MRRDLRDSPGLAAGAGAALPSGAALAPGAEGKLAPGAEGKLDAADCFNEAFS